MQMNPRVVAVRVIIALVLLSGVAYQVSHLTDRITALERDTAAALQIAQAATSEVEELQATIEDLKSEIEDLQSQR
jgi:hypothetical protein